ncbi:autotransporter outer membrane beta-barrel domain-containing protein [Bartonella sp. AU18XJBT]|uniref:autotransporter outer membrane beta-barrel domain-containing protein n=1 Tax=Bartonella sp. AU18XJBT TaxID=3019089 RepID=UPI00235E502E|nr:autotransporter outer membrane beta-barrel domain-containing protein [Bartonella sp. AU18XJBT]
MCKKYIYKKNFLLCTIAGTFIFSHFTPTYANRQPPEILGKIELNKGEKKTLNNVLVRDKGPGILAHDKAAITIVKSTIHTEMSALSVSAGGHIHAKEIEANTVYKGLETKNGIINVEDSTITVQRGGAGGIVFYETKDYLLKNGEKVVNKVVLSNTKLLVKNGTGILGPYCSRAVAEVQLKDSEIRSDVLLRNKTKRKYYDNDTLPVTLALTADNSTIEGRARTLKVNTTVLTLNNKSKWHLKTSQEEVDTDFSVFNYELSNIKQRALSTVSVLNLNNSSIIFKTPQGQEKDHYHTLYVGRTAEVRRSDGSTIPNIENTYNTIYNATGNAKIYFNIEWSDGLAKEQQKADRLLIHGDVSGSTTVHIKNLAKGEILKAEDSVSSNMRGLSLIQVSGNANEDSFKLAHGYTTMGGLPYKYILKAYGPTSNHGKADSTQSHLSGISQESGENTLKDYTIYTISGKMIEGVSPKEKDALNTGASSLVKENNGQKNLEKNHNFWDFRLQNVTLDDEGKIRALVPQVASYLSMPNAIFSAGLTDANNQNTLLNTIQETRFETKDHKNKGLVFSTYSNKMTLSSHRTPLQYGYGADIHYAALQAGITLAALEDHNMTTSFGLLGTYGKLAFTPKDMEGADKSTLDKWSIAAYSGLRHNNGTYIHALFSYGMLKGNITTALIRQTAELKNADTFSASATIGQKFKTSTKGLVFEPQAQLVYQHLMLGTLSDVDGFDVNMGNPHQWLVRVGGRLTKTTLSSQQDSTLSFYGKLNVVKAFSNNGTIQIGEPFHLDSMGDSIEGGLGVNAQLSQNIALHADVNYQHKLQKTGISGASFSGGVSYQF